MWQGHIWLQFAAAVGIDQREFNHRGRSGLDLRVGEANLICRPCSDNPPNGCNPPSLFLVQNRLRCCDNLSSLRCNWMALNADLGLRSGNVQEFDQVKTFPFKFYNMLRNLFFCIDSTAAFFNKFDMYQQKDKRASIKQQTLSRSSSFFPARFWHKR